MQDQFMAPKADGKRYLKRRSELTQWINGRANYKRISIIDDVQFDADVFAGVLRRVLGADVDIDTSRSIMALRKAWERSLPDLVFLDDRLGPSGNAGTHLPALRKLGFEGPIVVTSGIMTRQRRAELMQLGAAEMLHKDDLDTLAVMELIAKLIGAPPDADGGSSAS